MPSLIAPCQPLLSCPSFNNCGDSVFVSVSVIPRIIGGAIVSWTLSSNRFTAPLAFQLEVSRAGHDLANDWEVVQPFTYDINQAVDPSHRAAGWYQRTYYRIAAQDAMGTVHYSKPIAANQGRLNPAQLRFYNEIVRREQKRNTLRNSPTTPGFLLKIKYYGEKCTECVDPDRGESTDDQCPLCFGVGYVQGYHPPYPCFNVDLGPVPHNLDMYKDQGPIIAGGVGGMRYLNIPPVHPWDVWVDATSDYRYMLGQIRPTTVFGEINVVCEAAAARLPFDHPVYQIAVF